MMVLFVIRYRRSRHPTAAPIRGNAWLEAAWLVVPTLVMLAMFYVGLKGFQLMNDPPDGSLEIKVLARQFSWQFHYPNGIRNGALNVPVGRPVKLLMTSGDVIHSLYIPAFGEKKDTAPGLTTMLWFRAEEVGQYDLLCAGYCGVGHAVMRTQVLVQPVDRFQKWYAEAAPREKEEEK